MQLVQPVVGHPGHLRPHLPGHHGPPGAQGQYKPTKLTSAFQRKLHIWYIYFQIVVIVQYGLQFTLHEIHIMMFFFR